MIGPELVNIISFTHMLLLSFCFLTYILFPSPTAVRPETYVVLADTNPHADIRFVSTCPMPRFIIHDNRTKIYCKKQTEKFLFLSACFCVNTLFNPGTFQEIL